MYRPLDDSVFSCFSSKCCQTLSRSRRRCGKPDDRRRSSQRSTTRNTGENKYHRVGSNARERQIRSDISLLPGQHRLLLRSSSSNRFRKDQLQELFNVSLGRARQVRAGYRSLEDRTGNYLLPPDRAYPGKHTNLYHSVVAFSTLFFTLLLIISSISTSMTVQGVAGDDRTTNKSLASPSRKSGNLMQPPEIPFRPMDSLRTRVFPSKAVRLKNSRGLVSAMLSNQPDRSPPTVTAKTPRKLSSVSNSHVFKFSKKRIPAASFKSGENWLGVSGNDKLSPNLIEEKHRFHQPPGFSTSNETNSTPLIPLKDSDLNLSSITPSTDLTLANSSNTNDVRILAGSDRADDNHPSPLESGKRMSMGSLEVSAPERLFNRSRRYRKGVEIVGDSLNEYGQRSIETSMQQQQQQPQQPQKQPKTSVNDSDANETADRTQDIRWNIDNPNMLLEERFTTPFLSLHSDLQFPLEHSSTECLEDKSFPDGKEAAAFESTFERYNRRQRQAALDVCQNFGSNDQKKETFYLPFCSHLRVMDALLDEDLGSSTADKTRVVECPPPLERLLKFDQNAKSIHCLFENAISYYNCEDMYSKTARCDQCKAAHKLWICSLLIPHYSNDTRVPGCPHYEQIVENRCPYLSPHANNQYAGEAMFQSKNDRASINEVLMMKEDVRPTCHYPCLAAQQGSHNVTPHGNPGQVYDQNSRYPVDDSSLDEVKRSSPPRMSVCLSHELDTAPDWSFDQEDALLLDLELKRHRDGNT